MAGITLVSQGSIAASGTPAFGAATTAGNLLIAWVGSNGSTASFTGTVTGSGWVNASSGGGSHTWAAVWCKPNCGAGESAPVFADSAGSVFYSQLAEYSGAATSSPVDQSGGAGSGGSNQFWEVNLTPDTDAGDLVAACGFWNGSNSGGTVSVVQFTDSATAAISGTLRQAANGSGLYFASLWGIAGNTGGAGDTVFLNLSRFCSGGGTVASFKPASPVPATLTIPPQSFPVTWLNFPYSTRTILATGGTPPYTWSVLSGSLPPGLSLSASGVLSSSACTSAGTFSFTVKVADNASNTATAAQSITVNSPPAGFTSLTTTTSLTGNLGPYLDPAVMTPASDGFTTYVAANEVGPTGSYSQTLGAYSPSVFYVASSAGPPGTGQVQMGPCNSQQFVTYSSGPPPSLGPGGNKDTPLSAFSSWTATFDVTNPVGGAYELEFDIWTGYIGQGGQGTTVAAGSSGGDITAIASWSSPSPGVLAVASATGYPASGALLVQVSGGTTVGIITYAAISGNTFTGCVYTSGSATGTVATGNWVQQPESRDIMLWLDTSTERMAGGAILHTPNLTFGGGNTFDFYYYPQPYPNGPIAGAELIFILQGPGGSGTFGHMTKGTVDLLGPLNWLISQGFDLGNSGPPAYTPQAVPPVLSLNLFGWEICNTDSIANASAATTTENFIVNDFYYTYTLAAPATAPIRPAIVNRVAAVPARIG